LPWPAAALGFATPSSLAEAPAAPTAGALAALVCALLWALSLTLYRDAIRQYGSRAINLFKCTVAAALFLVTWWWQSKAAPWRELQRLDPAELWLLVMSGLVGLAIGDTVLFQAVKRLGTQRTLLIQCLAPVLTALLAWAWFHEELRPRQVLGIAATLAGIAWVIRDRTANRSQGPATWLGLAVAGAAAAMQAFGILLQKPAAAVVSPVAICAVRLPVAVCGLSILVLLAGPQRRRLAIAVWHDRPQLARLIPAAILGTYVAILLFTIAIASVPAGIVGSLSSTTPMFALPFAVLITRERFGPLSILGTVIGVAGVVLIVTATA
jgi:drug/metabolite transporter (DMT)-like permease